MDSILTDWLALLCKMLPGVKGAAAFQTREDARIIGWPATEPISQPLLDAARLAESQQSSLVINQDAGQVFAQPITVSGKPFGAIAILVETSNNQQAAIRHLIDWGGSWLEFLLRHHAHTNTIDELNILSVLKSLTSLERGVTEKSLVTQLADLFSADRVSLGFVTRHGIELAAISHRPTFDGRINLAGMIQSAMLEAVVASSMELSVTAEGVETEEQAKYLAEQGCDLLQGYLFSRPIEFKDIQAFCNKSTMRDS